MLKANFNIIFCACMLFIGSVPAACFARAGVEVRIQALEDVQPSGNARVEAHGRMLPEIDILLGDPVGLNIVLANTGDVETEPMLVALDPRSTRALVVIVHPDGHESLAMISDLSARTHAGLPRPMTPGEAIQTNTYIYTDMAEEVDGRMEYLFPKPGTYQLYVAYFLESPLAEQHEDLEDGIPRPASLTKGEQTVTRFIDKIEDGNGVITSNIVQVNVGNPIDGWDTLRESGLVGAVRAGSRTTGWLVNENQRDQIHELISQADRQWLTRFFDKTMSSVSDSADEQAG